MIDRFTKVSLKEVFPQPLACDTFQVAEEDGRVVFNFLNYGMIRDQRFVGNRSDEIPDSVVGAVLTDDIWYWVVIGSMDTLEIDGILKFEKEYEDRIKEISERSDKLREREAKINAYEYCKRHGHDWERFDYCFPDDTNPTRCRRCGEEGRV